MINPRTACLCALLVLMGACSSLPAIPGAPFLSTGAAAPSITPSEASVRERVARAITLLGEGQEDAAQMELREALAKSPADPAALLLMKQIETDPVTLLGAPAQDYVVAPGDTMSVLAGRFLGDPRMFYALARYNGLPAPNALAVGRTLRIPKPGQQAGQQPAQAGAPSAFAAAAPSGRPALDAVKANAVRLRGLEALNKGDVAQAVSLLEQADALNPADPATKRDLQRARRIQGALSSE